MVKAREQSKKLNYTDQFKIDHNFNPARDFSLTSKFHLKVAFIFATRVHVAQSILEREYNKKQFDAGV